MISIAFALFFAVVFLLYWGAASHSADWQNKFLLLVSLVFYAWMDLRFLGLLLLLILCNYLAGLRLEVAAGWKRKLIVWSGIVLNLGVLICFKYAGFFIPEFNPGSGTTDTAAYFNLLLPLGISFYSFQATSYLIDVHRGETAAAKDPVAFALYLSFFAKISAGPIEKPTVFLAQLEKKRIFDYPLAVDGARQVLWALFVKLVIADNCAAVAEPVLRNHSQYPGSSLLIAAFFYAFEVYGDFSAYSNLAIGMSKLLGLRLSKNFASPFFSGNIREFWSRWHITLTTWMTDYVYTPLSFYLRRWRRAGIILSTAITFILIGVWHGSNLTFLLFGVIHALYFTLFILTGSGRGKPGGGLVILIKRLFLFFWIMMALVAFGSDTVTDAVQTWKSIFSGSLFQSPLLPGPVTTTKAIFTFCSVAFLMATEYRQFSVSQESVLPVLHHTGQRAAFYALLILAILLFGSTVHVGFIYSQF